MSNTSGSRSKPATRGSIRQSLNFASVGKAFADVMNKDRNDPERLAKKTGKESSKAGGLKPRPSLDARPSPPPAKRSRTPDSKTITARRRSSLATASLSSRNSADDPSVAPARATPQSSVPARSSVLRPRPGSASNLPKYRPKSIVVENGKKPSSPGLSGSRKRVSTSDDEDKTSSADMAVDTSSQGRAGKEKRPISPLPQRAAPKVNSTNTKSKSTTPKPDTPSSVRRVSPNRMVKAVKAASTIPRPSSASSSSSSFSPRTPKASPGKGARDTRYTQVQDNHISDSSEGSSHSAFPESPLVRHVRQRSKAETPPAQNANMSHISEADSDDEEEDVENMLAPVAAPGAPTPAMPRLQPMRTRTRLVPVTPSKPFLPIHFEPPEASSTPPKNQDSPSFLRPNPSPGSDRSLRGGSILSWEQLASEASRTIPVDELGTMLSDMSAPFQPGPLSPMPTGNGNNSMLLDVNFHLPSSPGLSAFNSPSGYGSISQVLLPNVTPSPAVPRHSHSHNSRQHKDSEEPAVDTAIATLLRLQLSSAENTAKERLMRLQELEEEIHNLKQARAHETEVLSQQVSILETQLKNSLESRERSEGEQYAYTASLEEQLRYAQVEKEQAVRVATESVRQHSDASLRSTIESQNRKTHAACAASLAAREWRNVREQCEIELDVLVADKDMLELLLGELDLARQRLTIG
ncbi:hypothetical protein GGU10DRAFT_138084 [Lentinula aff. detonsa]|uniref:Uncharacterized protein n=1 Tax=Lentinula aff. detonsa TaxID=2804958 RepID=A0AA38KG31_9AGAR|nr:hypothetical protein GGU10DRAFT_138084 [Lentinula aff. detonsa]